MADFTAPPNSNLLQLVLPWSGALLAPIVAAVASLLSRSNFQRKQQEYEFKIKRLDLIERALIVGKAVSNDLGANINASLLESEYTKVLKSLVEEEPPSEEETLPFEKYKIPIRLLLVPKPLSVSGWIASFLFYFYLSAAVLTPLIQIQASSYNDQRLANEIAVIEEQTLLESNRTPAVAPNLVNPFQQELVRRKSDLQQRHEETNRYMITVGLINICIGLVVAALSRYWAIRAAKKAIRQKREAYQKEKEPLGAS